MPCVEVFRDPLLLMKDYPKCKFILNTRELEPWLASCEKHYNQAHRWNHPLWKYPLADFASYREHYIQYRMRVCEATNCLWWDITKEPEWGRVCDFLGTAVPHEPFPNVDRFRG